MDSKPLLGLPTQSPHELVPLDLTKLSSGKGTKEEAARLFEGMLMAQVFQSMRKTIQPSGLFGDDGQAKATYEYLLDQAVVEHAVASGKGWGLAPKLEAAWNRNTSVK